MSRSRSLIVVAALSIAALTVVQVRALRATGGPNGTAAVSSAAADALAAAPARVIAEGRYTTYPGAEAHVGSDVAGVVARVAVEEQDRVRRGDVLVELDARDLHAALAEARARAVEAAAEVRLAELERERSASLLGQGVGSAQTADRTQRDLEAARARLEAAQAAAGRLTAEIAKRVILSPIDGVVLERDVDPGEAVSAGDPLLLVADLTRTRIEAEVDEFDAARIVVGATVDITAEGLDGQSWRGTVEQVPDALVSRRLKPQDPARPIDTRVLLAKIALAQAVPLKLGQRVEVEIETR